MAYKEDKELLEIVKSKEGFDDGKDLYIEMELLQHLKIEDLYHDGTVLVKHSRIGRGKRV